MTKEEFITKLKTHASSASVFGGRFICISDDENHWKYERPAVDALEPSIDLSTEGLVLYKPNVGFGDNSVEEISYKDFVKKFKLNKK